MRMKLEGAAAISPTLWIIQFLFSLKTSAVSSAFVCMFYQYLLLSFVYLRLRKFTDALYYSLQVAFTPSSL